MKYKKEKREMEQFIIVNLLSKNFDEEKKCLLNVKEIAYVTEVIGGKCLIHVRTKDESEKSPLFQKVLHADEYMIDILKKIENAGGKVGRLSDKELPKRISIMDKIQLKVQKTLKEEKKKKS